MSDVGTWITFGGIFYLLIGLSVFFFSVDGATNLRAVFGMALFWPIALGFIVVASFFSMIGEMRSQWKAWFPQDRNRGDGT